MANSYDRMFPVRRGFCDCQCGRASGYPVGIFLLSPVVSRLMADIPVVTRSKWRDETTERSMVAESVLLLISGAITHSNVTDTTFPLDPCLVPPPLAHHSLPPTPNMSLPSTPSASTRQKGHSGPVEPMVASPSGMGLPEPS